MNRADLSLLGSGTGLTAMVFGGIASDTARWPLPGSLLAAVAFAGAGLAFVNWCSYWGWPHLRHRPPPTLDEIGPEVLRGHLEPAVGHGAPVTADAEQVARLLLLRHLTAEQSAEFAERACFTVTLPEAWHPEFLYRRWRVPGWNGYAASPLWEGRELPFALCVVPQVIQPRSDTLLSTKLLLEHDPGRFLRVGVVQH
jgi:hypothetical protein